MISELRFVKSYNSVWRSLAPTMEFFVRKANTRLYERNWPEMKSNSSPEDRSLVNQLAFLLIVNAEAAGESYEGRMRFVKLAKNVVEAEVQLGSSKKLSDAQLNESSILAERMCLHLFRILEDEVKLSPRYDGCGLINACFGDAIGGSDRIIELKDGGRPFRSYEFRQLTIYGALFLNRTGRIPSRFMVINSRRGVSVDVSVDFFANEVAGQSGYDYLTEVIRYLSDVTA